MSDEGTKSSQVEGKEKTTTQSTRGNIDTLSLDTSRTLTASGSTWTVTPSGRQVSNSGIRTQIGGTRTSGQPSTSRTSFAVNQSRMINPPAAGKPPPRTPPCEHKAVMKDLCVDCGIDIRTLTEDERRAILTEATVSMIHTVPELKVSADVAEKLGQTEQDALIKARKLVLLVDLDQTIIHTTNDYNDVEITTSSDREIHSFHLYPPGHPLHSNHPSNMYHTKLRPHTREFLDKVSRKYQLHICTFGSRMYAHTIASIIDPEKKFFEDRILSRDECLDSTSKTGNLRSLFPVGDKIVAIIDDREDVWNYSSNVIAVKPYHYFKNTGDINNPFKGRERDGKSSLLGMEADIKNLKDEPLEQLESFVPCPSGSKDVLPEKTVSQTDTKTGLPITSDVEPSSSPDDDDLPDVSKLQVPQSSVIERLSAPSTPASSPSNSATEETPSESIPSTPTGPSTPASDASDTPPTTKVLPVSDRLETLSTDSSSNDGASCVQSQESTPMAVPSSGEETSRKEENSKEEEPLKKMDAEEVAPKEEEPKSESERMKPKAKSDFNPTSTSLMMTTDSDDYLLYLEDILNRLHNEYYKEYDEKNAHTGDDEVKILPDLKEIIPRYRRQVLTNVSIVFSGIIPTNVPQERHRMFQVAKLLGAKVSKDVMIESDGASPFELTTHVVGAKYWTEKIKKALKYNAKVTSSKSRSKVKGHQDEARKRRQIFIVNPLWLTSCFERWERVDERLFLLQESDDFQLKDNVTSALVSSRATSSRQVTDRNTLGKTSPSSTASSVVECPVYDPVTGKRIIKRDSGTSKDTEMPRSSKSDLKESGLDVSFMFSSNEIQCMGKEVDDACSEGSEDFSDSDDSEDETVFEEKIQKRVLRGSDSSDDDDFGTLDADAPKGWKKLKTGINSQTSTSLSCTGMEEGEESTNDANRGLSSESSQDDGPSDDDESLDEDAALIEQQFLKD